MALLSSRMLRGEGDEPAPLPGPVAEVEAEIRTLKNDLASERDVRRAEALLGRLTILERKRDALLITEANRRQDADAGAAVQRGKDRREVLRRARGVTLARVRQRLGELRTRLAEIEQQFATWAEEVGQQQRAAQAAYPEISLDLWWECVEGTVARARRDALGTEHATLTNELRDLERMDEAEAP